MMLAFRYAARTHVGMVREKNDDSGYAGPHLLAVADGMGGVVGGDVASAITIEAVRQLDHADHRSPKAALEEAVSDANARIARRIRVEPRLDGMGTTLTGGILFDGDQLALVHIGDSFGYLMRDGELRKITKDHTFVQSLVDDGRLTEAQAKQHPHRAMLIRAIQGGQDTEPDISTLTLAAGDRLVFSSDGTEDITSDDLEAILQRYPDPERTAEAVVRLALRSGTSDNVTCVVADVVPDEAAVTTQADGAHAAPVIVGAASTVDLNADTATEATVDHPLLGDLEADPEPLGIDGRPPDGQLPPDHPDGPGHPVDHLLPAAVTAEGVDVEEEQRYAPRPPRRFRWLRRTLVGIVLLAALTGGGWLAYDWTQQQYYVGTTVVDGANQVTIYRGIAESVPGIPLSSIEETSSVTLPELPTHQRDRVQANIAADDLEHARRIVTHLEQLAAECAEPADSTGTDADGDGADDGEGTGGSNGTNRSSRTSEVSDGAPRDCAGVQSDDTGDR